MTAPGARAGGALVLNPAGGGFTMLRKYLCDLTDLDDGIAWALGRQLAETDDD